MSATTHTAQDADRIDCLDASDALARELDLLKQVAEAPDQRFLWFWKAPQSLVAPRKFATLPAFPDAASGAQAAGWPVALRSTGGDVTPQGAGIVNVTHVYASPSAKSFDLEGAYDLLCSPIEAALSDGATRGWLAGAFCDGAHNVQWNGLKFAGTAMRFRPCKADKSRYAVLAHALMLFESPSEDAISALNQFLKAVGAPRVIQKDAHTGLPPHLTPSRMMEALRVQFAAILPSRLLCLNDISS